MLTGMVGPLENQWRFKRRPTGVGGDSGCAQPAAILTLFPAPAARPGPRGGGSVGVSSQPGLPEPLPNQSLSWPGCPRAGAKLAPGELPRGIEGR